MPIDLADYERRTREAVALFWRTRGRARASQEARGVVADVGGRAAVTAGKNMDGFAALVRAVVVANGLPASSVFSCHGETAAQRHATLPGFYRPVKDWDVVVVHCGRLVAAFEFKSQVGPSFGNNFNNRSEEAIGMGEDLRVAFREGLLGPPPRPFVGYLMLLEDDERSRSAVRSRSDHLTVDPVFEGASYAERYRILCQRLVAEGLYDAAALLLSPPEEGVEDGAYHELAEPHGVRTFIAGLASRVAVETATT